MSKILIVTGPGGDAQGWGNMEATKDLHKALNSDDKSAEIAYVENNRQFLDAIDNMNYDIVWSSLYQVTDRDDIVAISDDGEPWVADILDEKQIPYIGCDALTMKRMIQKNVTHDLLDAAGASVPFHRMVEVGQGRPQVPYPAFVKPRGESRSVGINDDSVANTPEELDRAIKYVHDTFEQPALVEEYLPGDEYTVLMLANGAKQEFLPGVVKVEAKHFHKYPILRTDLRGVGLTKIFKPETRIEESIEVTRQAVEALNCLDHVRVDCRVGADDKLKIIEVNGIPGLKPIKSWSPQIYSLYHPSPLGAVEEYRQFVHAVVDSGLSRYGLI